MTDPRREQARVLAASMIGTAVEFYDFFIFGTASALVFGPLFFPKSSPAAQLLSSFLIFGIAYIARPLGAISFGHFGDRIGRKSTLVASLLLTGGSTLAIAFLPTYAGAGWIAPALLCLMRFVQGFGIGGEWGGAALLAVENAPKGWETRFGTMMQLGSPVGYIAANATFMLLALSMDKGDFESWGWRLPFLCSAVLVAVGLWVRLRIGETAAFKQVIEQNAPAKMPLREVFAHHWKTVLAGMAGVVCTFATFGLCTTFALAQATGPLGYQKESFLAVQLCAAACYAFAVFLSGIASDRTSPAKIIARSALAIAIMGLVFQAGLMAGSLAMSALTLCTTMFALGFNNGPLGAWMSGLFPVRIRYSGISFAFNMGGILGGAVMPIFAQKLTVMGYAGYVGLLLTLAGLVTFAGVKWARASPSQGAKSTPPRCANVVEYGSND